jgi:hypothetical protein
MERWQQYSLHREKWLLLSMTVKKNMRAKTFLVLAPARFPAFFGLGRAYLHHTSAKKYNSIVLAHFYSFTSETAAISIKS